MLQIPDTGSELIKSVSAKSRKCLKKKKKKERKKRSSQLTVKHKRDYLDIHPRTGSIFERFKLSN